MKNILKCLSVALLAVVSCVDNDLPYPVVVPNITSVIIDEASDIQINYDKRVVTVYLPETVDIRNVSIRSVQFDQEIAVPSIELAGLHDLTMPLKFNVHTYSDYDWTITAVRNITRYFTVEGQIGASVIDEYNRRAVATVGMDANIKDITVTSLKLGPKDLTTYSLEIDQMKDFTDGLSVEVTSFEDYVEQWTLYVEVTDASVEIEKINPWARKASVTFNGMAGQEVGCRYRESGTETWYNVPEGEIVSDGGQFDVNITGLKPDTDYEVMAICGSEESPVESFRTESATPMPNGSFEYASLVSGTSYYKFYDPSCGVEDGSYMFWGSGNGEGPEGVNGSANMGIIITYVDTDEKVDGKQSVRAQTSQMAGILAAGNLFTGQFAGLVGTSGGKVNFGRPWTTRPTALKLYCKYKTDKMDIIGGMPPGVTLTKDNYDCAEIKFAIGNWAYKKYGGTPSSPVHVNTTDAATFIDYNTDESTIANGTLQLQHDGYVLNGAAKVSQPTDEWIEYTIPLNYHDVNAIPTHIIISCASSKYGDYFSGCSSSKLWLDKFELVY